MKFDIDKNIIIECKLEQEDFDKDIRDVTHDIAIYIKNLTSVNKRNVLFFCPVDYNYEQNIYINNEDFIICLTSDTEAQIYDKLQMLIYQ